VKRAKLTGILSVEGVLRGYDQLVNIVLDEALEQFSGSSRNLGTTICRGTTVMTVCPQDGYEEIENPFLQDQE
jgi:U6 snRNA-associated Sm-like protein LSm7